MNKTPHLLAALAALSTTLSAAEWPEWRGPGAQGHAPGTGLPASWSETKNVAWKEELPGRAWSSPVIEGKQIWMTTAIETPASKEDTARRLKANTGDQALTLLAKVELRALCVDRDTGKLTQNILLLSLNEPQWVHALNSYASGTDRKSTRLNSSHVSESRMPSSA